MRQHTSTTPDVDVDVDVGVEVGSLWIDRAHHHRLVEVIQIPDEHHVRVRPIREACQQPPSYLETATRLDSNYEQVRR
jgi:hypothetical protein